MPIAVPTYQLTSGQHEPDFSLIQDYSAFPKKIEGPTVWTAEQYRNSPELWQQTWTEEQIQDLEKSYDEFVASGKDITQITKASFSTNLIFLITNRKLQ